MQNILEYRNQTIDSDDMFKWQILSLQFPVIQIFDALRKNICPTLRNEFIKIVIFYVLPALRARRTGSGLAAAVNGRRQ